MSNNTEYADFKLSIVNGHKLEHTQEIQHLSGYEREARFLYEKAWDRAIQFSFVPSYMLIAYITPSDDLIGIDKTPLPVGYLAAVDGDVEQNRDYQLKLPKGRINIISFAVNASARRNGIATTLFKEMLELSQRQLQVRIPDDNFEALCFVRSLKIFTDVQLRTVDGNGFVDFRCQRPASVKIES